MKHRVRDPKRSVRTACRSAVRSGARLGAASLGRGASHRLGVAQRVGHGTRLANQRLAKHAQRVREAGHHRLERERAALGPERERLFALIAPPLGLSKADRTFIERLILHEDEHVMVLNKPFGIAVQCGTGTKRHIDGLLAGMADRFGGRARLVHRLDRDTTGVLLVAKHRDAAAKLGRIFQTRSAAKTY